MNHTAELSELISRSSEIAVLTGAGISTTAGIPDFRGPDGLYSRKDIDADKLFDINYFNHNPGFFYKTMPEFFSCCENAMPTEFHILAKKIEDRNKLLSIITQNIDGLHEKAGNTRIINIHGSFNKFKCVKCSSSYATENRFTESLLKGNVPLCSKCGGTIKPEIVFFGESVIGFEESTDIVRKCDLLISAGTSLAVNPAGILPQYINHNASFVIVNKGKTPYDSTADLLIHDDTDSVAKSVMQNLGW